jgi:hypothetical protein
METLKRVFNVGEKEQPEDKPKVKDKKEAVNDYHRK